MKQFNKRYEQKYNGGVFENLKIIRDRGDKYFRNINRKRLTCPECGGKLSIHYGVCDRCGGKFPVPDIHSLISK